MKLKSILFFIFITASFCFSQTTDILNRFRLAQSYEQAGDLKKAESIYQELYNRQPENYQFFDALNRLYLAQKHYDQSIQLIDLRLKQNPMDVNLYGLLGSTYYLKGNENKAYEVWDSALKNLPPSQPNFRVIANYAIERRAFNKAIEILDTGRKTVKDGTNFSYELAQLYSTLMKYEQAAEEYCSIVSAEPNQAAMVQSRMQGYITKPEAFQPTVKVVEEWASKTDNLIFFNMLGWLYTEKGDYDKALEIFLSIDSKKNSNGSDLFNFAQRAYRDKYYNASAKAYKRIIEKYHGSPFSGNAHIGYAKTIEATVDAETSGGSGWNPFFNSGPENKDRYDEVISAYDELTKLYGRSEIETEANYRIGSIYMEKLNDLPAAEQAFNKVIEKAPVSFFIVPVLKQMAKLKIIQNDIVKAEEYIGKIITNPRATAKDKNAAEYMKGKMQFWKGDYARATETLSKITRTLEDDAANDAIELSMIINTSRQDSANLAGFASADLMAEQRKFQEAFEIFSELSANPDLLSLKDISALRKCEMMIAMGKLPEAITALQEIAGEKNPNIYADKSLFLIGQIYQFGINDKTAAVKTYESLLEKFPNSLYLDSARENITLLKNGMSNNL